jgi:hypothetical protein
MAILPGVTEAVTVAPVDAVPPLISTEHQLRKFITVNVATPESVAGFGVETPESVTELGIGTPESVAGLGVATPESVAGLGIGTPECVTGLGVGEPTGSPGPVLPLSELQAEMPTTVMTNARVRLRMRSLLLIRSGLPTCRRRAGSEGTRHPLDWRGSVRLHRCQRLPLSDGSVTAACSPDPWLSRMR